MSNKETVTRNGISTGSMLGLIFITLKLTGHIDWSWFWVLSPWILPLGLVLGIIALVVFFIALAFMWDGAAGVFKSRSSINKAHKIMRENQRLNADRND